MNLRNFIMLLLLPLYLYTAIPACASESSADLASSANNAGGANRITMDEKLGTVIDLTTKVVDQDGTSYHLGQLLDKPTLFLFDYYACTGGCGVMTARLMQIIPTIDFKIGSQYRILSLSFDSAEGPADAQRFRHNFEVNLPYKLAQESWLFLTAGEATIATLTNQIGYHLTKISDHRFVHPNMLVVLSKSGRIIRYLPGPDFLPFDVSMAILEAERETPELSIRRLISYCYDYDPSSNKYGINILRIAGVCTVLLLLATFAAIFTFTRHRSH